MSCLVSSFLFLSCLVLSRLVLSCLVVSCLVLSCLVLSCLVLSYLILSDLSWSLSFLVWSDLILSYIWFDLILHLIWSDLKKNRGDDEAQRWRWQSSPLPKAHTFRWKSCITYSLQVYCNTLVPFVTKKCGVLWLRTGWCRELGKNMGWIFFVFRMNILERWNALSDQLQEVWNANSIHAVEYLIVQDDWSPLHHRLHRLRAQMDYLVRLGIHPSHFVCAAPSDPYRLEGEWSFTSHTLRSLHFTPLVPFLSCDCIVVFFLAFLVLPEANVVRRLVRVFSGRICLKGNLLARWTALCIPVIWRGSDKIRIWHMIWHNDRDMTGA